MSCGESDRFIDEYRSTNSLFLALHHKVPVPRAFRREFLASATRFPFWFLSWWRSFVLLAVLFVLPIGTILKIIAYEASVDANTFVRAVKFLAPTIVFRCSRGHDRGADCRGAFRLIRAIVTVLQSVAHELLSDANVLLWAEELPF